MAATIAWTLIAIADVLALEREGSLAHLRRITRALTRLYDLGEFTALALTSAGAILAFRAIEARLPPPKVRGVRPAIALAVVAAAIGVATLPADLGGFVDKHAALILVPPSIVVPILSIGFAMIVPGAALAGRGLSRPWLRLLPIACGLVLAVSGPRVLLHEYETANFFIVWAAASMIGAALTGARLPLHLDARDLGLVAAFLGALAVVTTIVRPPAAVAGILSTSNGSVLAPLALRRPIDQAALADRAVIPPEQRAWFEPRDGLPAVPSTTSSDEAAQAIVILITVDSLRADFVASRSNDRIAPTLSLLRDEGVYFSRARAAGAQTACSLSALFMGKYFSQQRWGDVDSAGRTWPSLDPSPRFPTLLRAHGVKTVLFDVLPTYRGIAAGFSEVVPMRRSHRSVSAFEIANGVIKRLEAKPEGALFMYGHVMDVHAPYGAGAGGPQHRYRLQIGGVDQQITRIRQAIDQLGLGARTTLIVSADHGEAFGEHGTNFHGQDLYDELLRVPLLVDNAALVPHTVDAPVSLVDVAPTVLDLFGVPTPAAFMGESLVPVLRGAEPHFTRPIVAENRLEQAMVFPDDVKVVRDLRFGGHHVFDLGRDPDELVDRVDDPKFDATPRLALVGAFFRAHAVGGGYVTPYRR